MAHSNGPFFLINSHFAHDGPIRSIAEGCLENEILTGCQSDVPCVRRWKLSTDKMNMEEIGSPLFHDHWVTAITTLKPDATRAIYPEGCIITGCMDSIIRIFSSTGEPLVQLRGHQKGVIDFSWTREGFLISGSWDGNAIIWDLATSTIYRKLGPHENGVHVLGLSNGTVATTSTGESVEGRPCHFRLRLWNIYTGELISPPIEDHQGSIRAVRSLPAIDGMITVGNDGTVMIRSIDGQVIEIMQQTGIDESSAPFLLDCTALNSASGAMDIVSCGEDGSLAVWQGANLLQSIPHPTTIWTVLALGDDFLTGSYDGALRIFSRNPVLIESPQYSPIIQLLTSQLQEELLLLEAQKRKGPSAEDLAKATKWSDRGRIVGKSENEVRVFNQDGKLIAAQWQNGSWVIMGEVTGQKGDGGYIDGEYYDHVFPVEMERPNGVQNYKLGFHDLENPFVAAQRFIDKNQLEQYHLQQIADWIIARAKQSPPTLGGAVTRSGGGSSNGGGQSSVPAVVHGNSSSFNASNVEAVDGFKYKFYINGYIIFEDIPPNQKILSKLQEFNQWYLTSSNPALGLTNEAIRKVENMLTLLSQTSSYHISTISVKDIQLIITILQTWKSEHLFVFFDALRLLVTHPQGSEEIADPTLFHTILLQVQQLLSQHEHTPFSTIVTILRFLANSFKPEIIKRNYYSTPQGKEMIVTLLHIILSSYVRYSNKLVRLAAWSLLSNFLAVQVFTHHIQHPLFQSVENQWSVYHGIALQSLKIFVEERESLLVAWRALQVLGTLYIFSRYSDQGQGRGLLQKVLVEQRINKEIIVQSFALWQGQLPAGDLVLQAFQEFLGVL